MGHPFTPLDRHWVKIGSMFSGRYLCLVASSSPDKMVVVGDRGYGTEVSVEVCIAI